MSDLTVLLPTYARTAELAEMLWCLIHQTARDFEILVVNDCRWQYLRGEIPQLPLFDGHRPGPRLTFLNEPPFPTVGDKRQWMMEQATTPYVCWADDDDLCLPHFVETYLRAIAGGPDLIEVEGALHARGRERPSFTAAPVCMQSLCHRADLGRRAGFPAASGPEDQVFRERLRKLASNRITVPGSTYVYRWDNGTHHISGIGREEGALDGYRDDAQRRFDEGKEPMGVVEFVRRADDAPIPIFREVIIGLRHDYFATMAWPVFFLGDSIGHTSGLARVEFQ